ncbi:DUF4352 domain-containing protein [Alkalihalobacillus sp. FSL R5-0424]
MKNKVFASITLTMFILLLTACGDSEEPTTSESVLDEEETNETTEAEVEDKDETETETVAEDQLDLRMGDMATIHSTIGTYEVTLNHVHYEEEVDGEISELDGFLIANYTIENIGDDTITLMESINVLEATDDLEGTGEGNVSGSYESIESFDHDELAPGEKSTKDVLYLAYDSDDYYIRVVQGLIASEGVKNEVLFTFQKEEIE